MRHLTTNYEIEQRNQSRSPDLTRAEIKSTPRERYHGIKNLNSGAAASFLLRFLSLLRLYLVKLGHPQFLLYNAFQHMLLLASLGDLDPAAHMLGTSRAWLTAPISAVQAEIAS